MRYFMEQQRDKLASVMKKLDLQTALTEKEKKKLEEQLVHNRETFELLSEV